MKLKFNRMERLAGAFIVVAMAGTVIAAGTIFVRKGFLEEKISFHTTIPSAGSVYPGTAVQMAGVRIGAVEQVDLDEGGSARVEFSIKKKFANRVRTDSRVTLARPSLIGEQVFELSAGTGGAERARPGQGLELVASRDPMSILSGARVAELVEHVDQLILEMSGVLRQVSHGKKVQTLLGNLTATSELVKSDLPKVTQDLARTTAHLQALTAELSKTSPDGNMLLTSLLEESRILIKAIERNWFIRGHVKDIRAEEAEKSGQERTPAGK